MVSVIISVITELIVIILILNLGLKKLFKNWKTNNWKKSLTIFLISLLIMPVIFQTFQYLPGDLPEVNNAIAGLGVAVIIILFFLVFLAFYALINLLWFIVRLVRKKV